MQVNGIKSMSNWSRLEEIVKWADMSVHSFAMRIGLNRSENLYQIKRGRNGISLDLANRIVRCFPEINLNWILTGEGYMLNSEPVCYETSNKGIPFFSGELTEVITSFKELEPHSYIKLPVISDCDLALTISGDSMSPEIDSGSILLLKEVDAGYIDFGERYLVVTDKCIVVRDVQPVEGRRKKLSLVPVNREKYDTMTVSTSKIKYLFLVRGVITIKA